MAKIRSIEDVVKEACDKALYGIAVELPGYEKMNILEFIRLIDDGEINVVGRGHWIEDEYTYAGPGVSNFKCSVCGKFGGTWLNEIAEGDMYRFCPWCGSLMREEGGND